MTSYPTPWEKAGKTLTAIRQLVSIRNCLRLNCRSVCLTGEQNPACHSDFLPPSNPYRPHALQSSVLSPEFPVGPLSRIASPPLMLRVVPLKSSQSDGNLGMICQLNDPRFQAEGSCIGRLEVGSCSGHSGGRQNQGVMEVDRK